MKLFKKFRSNSYVSSFLSLFILILLIFHSVCGQLPQNISNKNQSYAVDIQGHPLSLDHVGIQLDTYLDAQQQSEDITARSYLSTNSRIKLTRSGLDLQDFLVLIYLTGPLIALVGRLHILSIQNFFNYPQKLLKYIHKKDGKKRIYLFAL